MKPRIDPRWLSVKQAAEYSGLSYGTIWNAVHRNENKLPALKLDGIKRILICKDDLDKWIEFNSEAV